MTTASPGPPQWTAWGTSRPELPRRIRGLLADELGDLTPMPEAAVTDARVAPSRLSTDALTRLRAAVGTDGVLVDDESRARHAGGQSYADIVRRRQGDA